ncbi:hypothetical protein Tco_0360502 [Tanacetum coccineum]
MLGENVTQDDTKEPHYHIEGEHVAMDDNTKKPESNKAEEEPTNTILISTVKPTETQPITTIISIPQPESSQAPKRTDKGKKIVTDDVESLVKLVPASKVVQEDPDEPIRVPYMINGKMYHLTNEEINEHLEKKDKIKKAAEEAKRLEMIKTKVIKIVQEEAEKIRIDPKKVISAKAAEQYKWTISSRLKPEPITYVKIHPKSKPAILTVYGNNDKRNFDVHNPFKLSDFGLIELDELGRKRKHMELEPDIKVPGLECNKSPPEAFQRWNDIHKVEMDFLLSYLVMASMIKSPENVRFCLKLKKLIVEHPDQEKLQSNRVKLEFVGYKLD